MLKDRKKILWGIITLAAVMLFIWGFQWATFARPPLPEAVQALTGNEFVQVTREPWLTMEPVQSDPTTGFIFYPGGRIDPRGYAPLLQSIAAEGYLVVVPEMPLNMAPFDMNVADDIRAHFPDISNWVIGGHSVGGTMAAQYADGHREAIAGLIIWASYPSDSADLSDTELPTTLIFGELDPRVNNLSVSERKHLLPERTEYVQIERGGHHQFGSYEVEPEEQQAAIPRSVQQTQIVRATLDLLDAVSGAG